MANCCYCGKPAGILRHGHTACRDRHQSGRIHIMTAIRSVLRKDVDLTALTYRLKDLAEASFIGPELFYEILVEGWSAVVDLVIENSVLTEDEEQQLKRFLECYQLYRMAEQQGSLTKLVKGAVIRNLLEGKTPAPSDVQLLAPIPVASDETLIRAFLNAGHYQQPELPDGPQDLMQFSERLAKGLYFRPEGFRGIRPQPEALVVEDHGVMGITNRRVFFQTSERLLEIKRRDLRSVVAYKDSVATKIEGKGGQWWFFVTGDGWFTYNLMANAGLLA